MVWPETCSDEVLEPVPGPGELRRGVLLCVLGWLLLAGNGSPVAQTAVFTAFLSAPFFLSFVSLAARPGEAVIGYKG